MFHQARWKWLPFHLGHSPRKCCEDLVPVSGDWVGSSWLRSRSQRQCRSQRSIPFPKPLLCLFSDNGSGGPKLWAWLIWDCHLGRVNWVTQGLLPRTAPLVLTSLPEPSDWDDSASQGYTACVQRWLQGFIQVLNFPAVWFCQHPHLHEVASIFNRPPVPREEVPGPRQTPPPSPTPQVSR